jgi:error-prone DNA polymerase
LSEPGAVATGSPVGTSAPNHREPPRQQKTLTPRLREGSFKEQPSAAAGGTDTFIKKMDALQLVETDLSATGISIGPHPMSFIREELKKRGILSAAETYDLKKRDIVMVAGAVIVRQRPSTAKDVVFITMEDETGHSNFIVLPDVFEKFRQVITHNNYLLIKGIVEEANMIKGLYFESISGFMADVKSHDFH